MKKFGMMLLAPLALALGACGTVDTGHEGVFVRYGKPTKQVSEGLYWYNWFSTDLVEINVQQQKMTKDTIAYTKDVQQATIKYSLTYSLDRSKVLHTYRTVGIDWADKLIPQVVEQSIKDVIGRSEAVKDTINNRDGVQERILHELKKNLGRRNIIVHGFELRDISFSSAFEKAVEAKQVAVENANAARNRTVQVQEEAKQKVIAAQGEAEAMRIKTQALANSPNLIEYEKVQKDKMAVQKWKGDVPQTMIPGAAIPMVNIK